MKIINITIKNIGLIADTVLKLDRPLILLYGDIKQGKSTVLNAVRLAFGGAFPADIIRHGELEASVKLETDDGYVILREFYRGNDGETKARPLTVQRAGVRVPKPVEFLKKFLNPFMLDGDYLANMPADERKNYFVSLFAVDTADLDKSRGECELRAKELRAKVKGYGTLNLTKVEPVNVDELKAKLETIRALNEAEKKQVAEAVEKQNQHNAVVTHMQKALLAARGEHDALTAKLTALRNTITTYEKQLETNAIETNAFEAEIIDTSALEEEISNAKATNILAQQYADNLAKAARRTEEERDISELEQRQRDIAKEKAARLRQLSEECGVEGLVFIEGGDFTFENTSSAMLSTSQIMKLSTLLSNMYPDGVGLDLIDRAESLGKSVFDFVQRAKDGNKTILATIVGEKPATVPDEVGVFIVEGGKLS